MKEYYVTGRFSKTVFAESQAEAGIQTSDYLDHEGFNTRDVVAEEQPPTKPV